MLQWNSGENRQCQKTSNITKSENLSIEPPIVGFKDFKTFVHFKKSNQVFNKSAVQSILVFS